MPSARPGNRRRPSVRGCRQAGSRGFTLLELLTVIAVVAILATLAIGAIRGAKERGIIARTRGELAAVSTALEQFKTLYGDYPQTGAFAQAPATPTAVGTGPGVQTAQAKLFNCLTGVFGARAFNPNNRVSGPNLLEISRFSVNGTLTNQFLVPVSNAPNPPAKVEQNACLVDPWGRRYSYYYRSAASPAGWQATGYVLYSAGSKVAANGTQTAPINPTNGLLLATQTAEMLDNIHANPP
jgi:prepilin-type N-terminal cleavage/methylation domain-containing protein